MLKKKFNPMNCDSYLEDITAAEETQIEYFLSHLLSDFDDYNSDDDEHVHSKFVNLPNFEDIQEEICLKRYNDDVEDMGLAWFEEYPRDLDNMSMCCSVGDLSVDSMKLINVFKDEYGQCNLVEKHFSNIFGNDYSSNNILNRICNKSVSCMMLNQLEHIGSKLNKIDVASFVSELYALLDTNDIVKASKHINGNFIIQHLNSLSDIETKIIFMSKIILPNFSLYIGDLRARYVLKYFLFNDDDNILLNNNELQFNLVHAILKENKYYPYFVQTLNVLNNQNKSVLLLGYFQDKNKFKTVYEHKKGSILIQEYIKTNTIINNNAHLNDIILKAMYDAFNDKDFVFETAKHEYGNYIIGVLIEKQNETSINILNYIFDDYYSLCFDYFSSNITKITFEHLTFDQRMELINVKLGYKKLRTMNNKNKYSIFTLTKIKKFVHHNSRYFASNIIHALIH